MASLVHQVTKIPVIMRWLPPKRVDHDSEDKGSGSPGGLTRIMTDACCPLQDLSAVRVACSCGVTGETERERVTRRSDSDHDRRVLSFAGSVGCPGGPLVHVTGRAL